MSTTEELKVCDIIGQWGPYQWSLSLFGVLYTLLASNNLAIRPIWISELAHVCRWPSVSNSSLDAKIDWTSRRHECSTTIRVAGSAINLSKEFECTSFLYDNEPYGKILTNTFDLVCSRRWLRKLVLSFTMAGVLLSVTLGFLSGRFGRMSCIKCGFLISLVASSLAALTSNFLILNLSIMLITCGQLGVVSALYTLVAECTSARFRFVPTLEYSLGWSFGLILAPVLHQLLGDYRYYMVASTLVQLVMIPWLRWGVFESPKWLLSEGKTNQAQIELQRASRINGIQAGSELAQKIAQLQVKQMLRAYFIIEEKLALEASKRHLDTNTKNEALDELSVLGGAIRRSITTGSLEGTNRENYQKMVHKTTPSRPLSQTLTAKSLSVRIERRQPTKQLTDNRRESVTNQCLVELALKYSKFLQEQKAGNFLAVQIFHQKLYKLTILSATSTLLNAISYFGLSVAEQQAALSITYIYMISAVNEWLSSAVFIPLLWVLSRRWALVLSTIVNSLVCISMLLIYQLLPENPSTFVYVDEQPTDMIEAISKMASEYPSVQMEAPDIQQKLRDTIAFWLKIIGHTSIIVTTQLCATVALERYPNNLRQAISGTVMFAGRIGPILMAPLMLLDQTDGLTFRLALVLGASVGLILSAFTPLLLRNSPREELSDRLNDAEGT